MLRECHDHMLAYCFDQTKKELEKLDTTVDEYTMKFHNSNVKRTTRNGLPTIIFGS